LFLLHRVRFPLQTVSLPLFPRVLVQSLKRQWPSLEGRKESLLLGSHLIPSYQDRYDRVCIGCV